MVRKNNRRVRNSSRRRGGLNNMLGMTTKIPFNFILSHTYTAQTVVSTPFNPGADTILGNIGQNFEFYRYVNIKVMALPAAQNFVYTYYPNTEANSATDSYNNIALSALCRISTANTSVPIMLNVPRNLLYQTPEDWWSTNPASALYRQGRLVSSTPASYTGTINFRITGMIEFKSTTTVSQSLKTIPPISALNCVGSGGSSTAIVSTSDPAQRPVCSGCSGCH